MYIVATEGHIGCGYDATDILWCELKILSVLLRAFVVSGRQTASTEISPLAHIALCVQYRCEHFYSEMSWRRVGTNIFLEHFTISIGKYTRMWKFFQL